DAARELVRRMEVTVAGVWANHGCPVRLPSAHGADVIVNALEHDGVLDVGRLQEPGQYAQPRAGFASTYYGSEVVLGALRASSPPKPGERFDEPTVRSALGDLIDLAQHDSIASDTLAGAGHLCVCAAANGAPDGDWLRRLLLEPGYRGPNERRHAARRATTRLLLAAIGRQPNARPLNAFRGEVCFGDFLDSDSLAVGVAEGQAWRGVMLRNYSVGAWRRLWAWMVNGVEEPQTASEIAERVADALPEGSMAALIDALPARTAADVLLDAEEQVRGASWQPDPTTELQMLCLGAQRLDDLDGPARTAFVGQPGEDDLGPLWFSRHLDVSRRQSVRDFGYDLARRLVARSRRVALSKTRLRPDGTLWMPTRLRDHAGLLVRRDTEGWNDVALRIDTYAQVLAGAGVLRHRDDDSWEVLDQGAQLVG
ncbi:MAG TPA: hypothetical protein VF533_23525, partial [Solirubrobacteraceae bacterium]